MVARCSDSRTDVSPSLFPVLFSKYDKVKNARNEYRPNLNKFARVSILSKGQRTDRRGSQQVQVPGRAPPLVPIRR